MLGLAGYGIMLVGLYLVDPGLAVALIGMLCVGVALWGSRGNGDK